MNKFAGLQVLQQSASHLLMAILEGLLGPYPVGQYTPAHALDRSQGRANGNLDHEPAPPLEAWCTSSAEDPINAKLAPQWHTSTSAEVQQYQAYVIVYSLFGSWKFKALMHSYKAQAKLALMSC